jgi:hypothetical protein
VYWANNPIRAVAGHNFAKTLAYLTLSIKSDNSNELTIPLKLVIRKRLKLTQVPIEQAQHSAF